MQDISQSPSLTTKRFDIPIGHLDYDYIGKCKDVKELEKIYVILKSGDEGIYPDLEKTCEEKVRKLNPNSRVLRKETRLLTPGDIERDEWQSIDEDLKSWSSSMKSMEGSRKKSDTVIVLKGQEFEDESLPPVRSSAISANGTINNDITNKEQSKKTKSNKRVMPRDYREWDKIDVDKELEKVDDQEEKPTKSVVTKAPDIETSIDSSGMSEEEKFLKATREKDKGNEAFRAGDHAEAIVYYSRSISLQPTAASYNNRALSYLKLSNWNKALSDCNTVLNLEPENIKAILRRGSAYKGKKDFQKAVADFHQVLELEADNKRAKELIEELEKDKNKVEEERRKKKEKGRRMVIEDVEGDEEEEEDNKKSESEKPQTEPLTNGFPASEETISEPVTNHQDTSKTELKTEAENTDTVDSKSPDAEKGKEASSSKTDDVTIENSDAGSKTENTSEEERTVEQPVMVQRSLPQVVAKIREEGNNLFRSGQYGEAIQKYTAAINELKRGQEEQKVNLSLLHSNRSACNLKIGSNREAIKDATCSLELVPHAIKPLLRRGAAYEDLERYGDAYVDYKHALQIDSSVEMAHQGASRCQGHLRDVHGMRWREKIPPLAFFSSFDVPVIVDAAGGSVQSKVTAGNVPKETVKETKEKQTTTNSQDNSKTSPTVSQTSKPASASQPSSESAVLSKEEQFDEAKTNGNKCVQEGSFHKAISCYGKCIELMPDRTVSYTNRALCYLRLNQPSRTEEDCCKALALEPENVKALFRRGQARKMMKNYKGSLEDLTHLLKIDPKNTAGKKELDLVKNYYREELAKMKQSMAMPKSESARPASAKGGNKQRKKMVIQEVDDEEEEDTGKENKQKKSNNKEAKDYKTGNKSGASISKKNQTPEKQTPKQAEKQTTKPAEKSAKKQSNKTALKQTSTGLPTAAPSAPKLENATPYEFIQAWNSLKQAKDNKPYADLLQQIPPEQLPTVISNKLDGPMLSTITTCVAERFVAEGDSDRGYRMLCNLCKVPRFMTISMFQSQSEKKDVQNLISKLAEKKSDVYNAEDLTKLRKDYGVS